MLRAKVPTGRPTLSAKPLLGLGSTELVELVRGGASGELICASSALEVHVYLQLGRIAWATDSRHAFVFTRHLQEHAQVTKEQFREVLEGRDTRVADLEQPVFAWK